MKVTLNFYIVCSNFMSVFENCVELKCEIFEGFQKLFQFLDINLCRNNDLHLNKERLFKACTTIYVKKIILTKNLVEFTKNMLRLLSFEQNFLFLS